MKYFSYNNHDRERLQSLGVQIPEGYANRREYKMAARTQREQHELQLRYEQQQMNLADINWQEYEMAARAQREQYGLLGPYDQPQLTEADIG